MGLRYYVYLIEKNDFILRKIWENGVDDFEKFCYKWGI